MFRNVFLVVFLAIVLGVFSEYSDSANIVEFESDSDVMHIMVSNVDFRRANREDNLQQIHRDDDFRRMHRDDVLKQYRKTKDIVVDKNRDIKNEMDPDDERETVDIGTTRYDVKHSHIKKHNYGRDNQTQKLRSVVSSTPEVS